MFTVLAILMVVAILIGVIGPSVLQALEKHHIVTNPRKRAQWASVAGFLLFLVGAGLIGYNAYQLESLGVAAIALPIIVVTAALYSMVIYIGFWFADRLWTRRTEQQNEDQAIRD